MHARAAGFVGWLGLVAKRAMMIGATTGTVVPLSQLASRALVWGAAGGAVVGAVTGLVIGIWAYLPTAPFAAIEGAVFGSVSGTVMAFLLGGVAAIARLWARR